MASPEKQALPTSLAHLNDSIGYELPHAISHAKRLAKATTKAAKQRELSHALGHLKATAQHNKKLTKKLMMIPSVRSVVTQLKQDKRNSYGP